MPSHQPRIPSETITRHHRVLFSSAWTNNIVISSLPDPQMEVTLSSRTLDWLLPRSHRLAAYLVDSLRLARNSSEYDITIVSSGGAESFITPLLWRLFNPRRRSLVLMDILPLRWRRLDRLFALALRNVRLFLCIRQGDIAMLNYRFGVPKEKCRFIPMPCPPIDGSAVDGPHPDLGNRSGYIYSAGASHRDWPLLIQAVQDLPFHCVIATPSPLADWVGGARNLTVLPSQTPESGRGIMHRAALVALAFEDTDLACGPTIVLDALALGIPVAATDTNACRDYIVHGETGLLSDPDSPEVLSRNIMMLMNDDELRAKMGSKAREYSQHELGRQLFEKRVVDALRSIVLDGAQSASM